MFRDELKKEIAFMKNLGYHPHVLSMIGCVSSIYEPLLVVEYCANGDLLTLLRRHKDYILIVSSLILISSNLLLNQFLGPWSRLPRPSWFLFIPSRLALIFMANFRWPCVSEFAKLHSPRHCVQKCPNHETNGRKGCHHFLRCFVVENKPPLSNF